MSESTFSTDIPSTEALGRPAYELSMIELVTVLGHEKKLVFGLPFLAAAIAATISLLLTPLFTAKTVLLPPQQQQSSASALLEQLGPLAGAAGAAAGIKNPTDMYVEFLKSNAVRDRLIERLNLKERYKKSTLTDTRKALDKVTEIRASKSSGLITIEATDPEPTFAADLANAHIEAMQHLMSRLAVAEARQRKRFFEIQVEQISEKPFRDVRIQEALLAAMIRQYESARMDEAKEAPLLQQIDVARPPERRSKPQRGFIVAITGITGFLLGAMFALFRQTLRRVSQEKSVADQLIQLKVAWQLPWKL